jgi:hypothetical protein
MQRFVWNLRHSGLASDRCRSNAFLWISTLAAFNGAQQQVACEIGQQHVRDN